MKKIVDLARAVLWLLPAGAVKNRLLRLAGHRVAPSARVGPNLVWRVDRVELAARSRIGRFNVIKDLRLVRLEESCSIGRMNVISSHPVHKRFSEHGGTLTLARGAKVTSRHHIDCAGPVRLGAFSSIAGSGTLVLSHSIDLREDAQSAGPVTIGAHSFVGARCILLGGSELPGRSVLGAGSVLVRSRKERTAGLWSGNPAEWRSAVDGRWFSRTDTHTRRVLVPGTEHVIEDAF